MKLPGVVLLAGYTSRSQAYAQALCRAELAPELTILYGQRRPPSSVSAAWGGAWKSVPLPRLAEPLEETFASCDWKVQTLEQQDVNCPEVAQALASAKPRLVIYSGYGGQIVGAPLLGLGAPFLHLHSGWLPEYRGSTTLYYALLNGEQPAVSAILLAPSIDTGPIVTRKRYPIPPAGMDIDNLYDPAIRADLLIDTLRQFLTPQGFSQLSAQGDDARPSYYIIHPVLKHIALLALR